MVEEAIAIKNEWRGGDGGGSMDDGEERVDEIVFY